jgi:hypothetical protein
MEPHREASEARKEANEKYIESSSNGVTADPDKTAKLPARSDSGSSSSKKPATKKRTSKRKRRQ